MSETHTPGPWELGSWGDNVFSVQGDKWVEICRVKRDSLPIAESQDRADARLISAAPDLLSACERWLQLFDEMDPSDPLTIATIKHHRCRIEPTRAAISKAKGPTHAD